MVGIPLSQQQRSAALQALLQRQNQPRRQPITPGGAIGRLGAGVLNQVVAQRLIKQQQEEEAAKQQQEQAATSAVFAALQGQQRPPFAQAETLPQAAQRFPGTQVSNQVLGGLLQQQLGRQGPQFEVIPPERFGELNIPEGTRFAQRDVTTGKVDVKLPREPLVQVNTGNIPTGFRPRADKPGELEPIPGGPAATQTAEQAGRTALISQGLSDTREVVPFFLTENEDGTTTINRENIALFRGAFGNPVPGTDGTEIFSLMSNAIASRLRIETGAQANEQEIRNSLQRFAPRITDSDGAIRSKLRRLEDFFESAAKTTKGLTTEQRRSIVGGQGPNPPEVINFEDLPQ